MDQYIVNNRFFGEPQVRRPTLQRELLVLFPQLLQGRNAVDVDLICHIVCRHSASDLSRLNSYQIGSRIRSIRTSVVRAANALFARYVADGERALAAGGEDLHADVEAAERDLLDEELAACAARAVRGPVHNADRARRLAIRFAKKLLVERWPCAIAQSSTT